MFSFCIRSACDLPRLSACLLWSYRIDIVKGTLAVLCLISGIVSNVTAGGLGVGCAYACHVLSHRADIVVPSALFWKLS